MRRENPVELTDMISLHLKAMSCTNYTHPANTVQSGETLVGTTGDQTLSVCVNGFSFGGGVNTLATKDFTCEAVQPATVSTWSPDTSLASSKCARKTRGLGVGGYNQFSIVLYDI